MDSDFPRPRDEAVESELTSLIEQEEQGHGTPKEARRREQLERELHVDSGEAHREQLGAEHAEELREEDKERDRHKRHPGSG